MIVFKERLRELRTEKGLNQREFSKILNIAQPTLCRWETGEREPDLATIEKICKYFDVTSDYLIGLSDDL